MKTFVLGFAFNADHSKVVLIQKNRPEFQKGKCNGVGGKIEGGEFATSAMSREFEEETGVTVPKENWELFLHMECEGSVIYCYKTILPDIQQCQTKTDERIWITNTKLMMGEMDNLYVSNVKWLILMALDPNFVIGAVTVR